MRAEFHLVPEYSKESADPSAHDAKPAPIIYRPDPRKFEQARLKGREVFVPEIDLSRYRCRAHIDWVFLQVRLGRQTQSKHVSYEIARVLGRKPAVLASSEEHDASLRNYTGDEFRVKLQDPTLPELRELAAALEERWGIVGVISVVGIELAIDFFPAHHIPAAEIDGDRDRLVAVLQRHHLAPWELFSEPRADQRFFYIGAGGKGHTVFVVPEAGRAAEEGRSICASMVADKETRKHILRCAESEPVPMPVDGTLYAGPKHGAVMFRVQNKVFDGSDPETRGKVPLPLRKRRARIEVTLLNEGVRETGVETLDDLATFDFSLLRKPYFSFKLPTFPTESTKPLIKALYPVIFRDKRDLFLRGGCHLLELCEGARLHETRWLKLGIRKEEDPGASLPPRIRTPDSGWLVTWEDRKSVV